LNHVQLWEIVSVLDNVVPWEVNSGVKIRQEIAAELSTGLESVLIIVKHVLKVVVETVEKLFYKLIPDLWLQLVEELLGSD
jgi:hypothetical protein